MEKTINVGGLDVKFKASALTPVLYRQKFGREFFADAQKLAKAYTSDADYQIPDLECFERIAYIMARQADPDVPDDPAEWMDSLPGLSLYMALPEIITLWGLSTTQTAVAKKKQGRQSGK